MGFRITILSVPAPPANGVLQHLGLKIGEEPDAENETPFSGAVNGNKYLVWVNDDWHAITDEELLGASHAGDILMLRANETVMISEIAEFKGGKRIWSLLHDFSQGMNHLVSTGKRPDIWEKIRDDLLAKASADPDDDVDFVYDVPVVLFQHLTGFRYDQGHELTFVALEHPYVTEIRKPFWKFWAH